MDLSQPACGAMWVEAVGRDAARNDELLALGLAVVLQGHDDRVVGRRERGVADGRHEVLELGLGGQRAAVRDHDAPLLLPVLVVVAVELHDATAEPQRARVVVPIQVRLLSGSLGQSRQGAGRVP